MAIVPGAARTDAGGMTYSGGIDGHSTRFSGWVRFLTIGREGIVSFKSATSPKLFGPRCFVPSVQLQSLKLLNVVFGSHSCGFCCVDIPLESFRS
jgi:hypothetical protein